MTRTSAPCPRRAEILADKLSDLDTSGFREEAPDATREVMAAIVGALADFFLCAPAHWEGESGDHFVPLRDLVAASQHRGVYVSVGPARVLCPSLAFMVRNLVPGCAEATIVGHEVFQYHLVMFAEVPLRLAALDDAPRLCDLVLAHTTWHMFYDPDLPGTLEDRLLSFAEYLGTTAGTTAGSIDTPGRTVKRFLQEVYMQTEMLPMPPMPPIDPPDPHDPHDPHDPRPGPLYRGILRNSSDRGAADGTGPPPSPPPPMYRVKIKTCVPDLARALFVLGLKDKGVELRGMYTEHALQHRTVVSLTIRDHGAAEKVFDIVTQSTVTEKEGTHLKVESVHESEIHMP